MEIKADELTVNGVVYVPKGNDQPATSVDGLKYAILRSKDQGVVCGFVESESEDGRRVVVRKARQMWQWSSRFVLPDVAEYGLEGKWDRKLSCEMSEPLVMTEVCGHLYCTDFARDSLRNEPAQDRSNG